MPAPAPRAPDQTASLPVDLESLLPGRRCVLDVRPADMFLVRHGGFLRRKSGEFSAVRKLSGSGFAANVPEPAFEEEIAFCLKL